MESLGLHTGEDLKSWPLWKMIEYFGKSGPWYYDLCRGIDKREVITERRRKSLGKERTFGEDVDDIHRLADFLDSLLESIWMELEDQNLRGRTVTVKVKYSDFKQVTRSRSSYDPVNTLENFREQAHVLLAETEAGRRPVRLIGASVSSFMNESDEEVVRQLALEFV